jgi:hypothetical protein
MCCFFGKHKKVCGQRAWTEFAAWNWKIHRRHLSDVESISGRHPSGQRAAWFREMPDRPAGAASAPTFQGTRERLADLMK